MLKLIHNFGRNILVLMFVFSQLGWAAGKASAQAGSSPSITTARNKDCLSSASCTTVSALKYSHVISPPANVQASDGTYTTKVLVSWDASSGATSYHVYRASSAAGTKTLVGSPTDTPYADTSAAPGDTYYYWVVADNGIDQSSYSDYDTGWRTEPHVSGWTGADVQSVPAALITACQLEGVITIIATPDDWANYGLILADFVTTTGAAINSINPDAGSADELAAIEANLDNRSPQAPDVVDVGYAYGAQGKAAGDFQAYKVSNWAAIPATLLGISAKDPDGYWTGGYYGTMAMEINTDVVSIPPANWPDLLNPMYKGQVALSGDPRSSNMGFQGVYAAALGNRGSLDNAQPGLDFFHNLNILGNFAGVNGNAGAITNGTTPIVLSWDYLALNDRDPFPAITVTYPSPTIASMYVQAISAYAPHPNCAKVWMKILNADEGQLAWMEGYTHVTHQADMDERGVIPQWLKDKLPDSSGVTVVSPTAGQLSTAKTLIRDNWLKTISFYVYLPLIRR